MKSRFLNVLLCAAAAVSVLAAVGAAYSESRQRKPDPDILHQAEDTGAVQVTEITATETAVTQTETTAAAVPAAMPNRNLNTATAGELMRVPGIGSELAEAILAERAACGGFTRRSDLLRISGIGEARMQAIMEEFEILNELPPEQTSQTRPQETVPGQTNPAPQGPFEMNCVTREELLSIPGMHENQADAILALREKIHRFRNFYELTLVDELSGAYIENVLADWLYVAPEP